VTPSHSIPNEVGKMNIKAGRKLASPFQGEQSKKRYVTKRRNGIPNRAQGCLAEFSRDWGAAAALRNLGSPGIWLMTGCTAALSIDDTAGMGTAWVRLDPG